MFAIPLVATIAGSYLTSAWGGWILPLLSKIPWQVWAAIAGIIAILYYGHVREARGYDKCQAAVKIATDKEIARQSQISTDVLREAQQRAADASKRELEAKDEAGKLQADVDRLKTAKTTCLPNSITKRYRK